jgi:2'-5' RNA ligase
MAHARIFYALWPEAAETQALAASCRTLFPLAGRPVDARDYHVTLAFVGQVEVTRVSTFLELAGPIEPITLEFDLLEHWVKPRVLAAVSREVPEALRAIVDRLWHRLDRLGIARDPRPLRPHVTLARDVRQWHAERTWRPVTWHARRVRLVESRPQQLPRYWPLDGPMT